MEKAVADRTPLAPRTTPVGACAVCASADSEAMCTLPDRLHATPGSFSYRRCRSCRTVFQDPRVVAEDLELCYPDDYLPHAEQPAPPSPGRRPLSGLRDALRRLNQDRVRGQPVRGPG